jgi:8-oxo-dGTP diphosphatase
MQNAQLERPIVAVDVAVFTIHDRSLFVLLTQRDNEPFQGALALPGVAVEIDETLLHAAQRALDEKANWRETIKKEIFLEQLAAFDGLYRDPRGRTIGLAYIGLTQAKPENAEPIVWRNVSDILKGSLPFDHEDIIQTAVHRLKGKLRYTNIAKAFLPERFVIEALQDVYEAILKQPLNTTNFRSKLLKIGLIKQASVLNEGIGKKGGRPPHLYTFADDSLKILEQDFV